MDAGRVCLFRALKRPYYIGARENRSREKSRKYGARETGTRKKNGRREMAAKENTELPHELELACVKESLIYFYCILDLEDAKFEMIR
jgi:hypothetical protein